MFSKINQSVKSEFFLIFSFCFGGIGTQAVAWTHVMQPEGAWGWNSRNLWPTFVYTQAAKILPSKRGREGSDAQAGESPDICSERASTNAQCHVCMTGTGDERKERSNNGFPRLFLFLFSPLSIRSAIATEAQEHHRQSIFGIARPKEGLHLSANDDAPGCVNAAGKLRQKW